MRILWVANVAVELEDMLISRGGWMKGALKGLLESKEVEIAIAYPSNSDKKYKKRDVCYYPFEYGLNKMEYSVDTKKALISILKEYKPQVIHIWGTEYPHSLGAVEAAEECTLLEKTVISIQGLVSVYANVYFAGVPRKYMFGGTLKELYKRESLKKAQKSFVKRGTYEKLAIQKVKHIIGRTEWDEACTLQMNPSRTYHFCNESLRESFYTEEKWDIKNVKKYSLFVSQAGYPIKGLHQLFMAMKYLNSKYPEMRVYIAGPDKFCLKASAKKMYNMIPTKFKRDSYENYLYTLAKKTGILEKVSFLGELNEDEMKEQYLKTHVFVSPSIIENESNSVSEAKILGVPCVTAYVGGVTSRITHGEDGCLYPWNEPNMLAYYIDKMFSDDAYAEKISRNARKCMGEICEKENNAKVLLDIYKEINEG